MRIWHKSLISYLCNVHLTAMWREGLISFYGIIEHKNGWRHHPARKEFEHCPDKLWSRLRLVKQEADRRGLHFRDLPDNPKTTKNEPQEWQGLKEQIEILREKNKTIKRCKCKVTRKVLKKEYE